MGLGSSKCDEKSRAFADEIKSKNSTKRKEQYDKLHEEYMKIPGADGGEAMRSAAYGVKDYTDELLAEIADKKLKKKVEACLRKNFGKRKPRRRSRKSRKSRKTRKNRRSRRSISQ